jgi:hypothetical protein
MRPGEWVEKTDERVYQSREWTEFVANEDQLLFVENRREDFDDGI